MLLRSAIYFSIRFAKIQITFQIADFSIKTDRKTKGDPQKNYEGRLLRWFLFDVYQIIAR